ncbi:MAG: hypothetical protein OEV92_06840 [Nitrospinota bacterium]|nr:hypothetical protein [Nitrospinota bacterium]
MRKTVIALSLGLIAMGAATASVAQTEQDYVVFKMPDGSSAMEKAWVVSSRIIVTTPFETEAYLADKDGVFTGSKSEVKYLARNRGQWLKVYTSDRDLAISAEIPREILEAFTGLNQAIERAGGLDKFRQNVRPYNGDKRQRREMTVTVGYRQDETI